MGIILGGRAIAWAVVLPSSGGVGHVADRRLRLQLDMSQRLDRHGGVRTRPPSPPVTPPSPIWTVLLYNIKLI